MNRTERLFRAGFIVFTAGIAGNVIFSLASARASFSDAYSADLVGGVPETVRH